MNRLKKFKLVVNPIFHSKFILFIFCFLIYGFDLNANVKDCEEFRIDLPGGSLSKVRHFDQMAYYEQAMPLLESEDLNSKKKMISVDTSICYAVSAAQQLDAYRMTYENGDPQFQTSPIHLAALATSNFKEGAGRMIALGYSHHAAVMGLKYGTCDEKFLDINPNELTDLLSQFRKHKSMLEDHQQAARIELEKDIACRMSSKFKVNLESFATQLRVAFSEEDEANFIKTLTSEMCSNHTYKLKSSKINNVYVDVEHIDIKEKIELLSSSFGNKPIQPVSIIYPISTVYAKGEGNHISVIAGQRIKNNRCQILVRDSFGKDSCEKIKYKPNVECISGQFWMDRDELIGKSTGISWLEPVK